MKEFPFILCSTEMLQRTIEINNSVKMKIGFVIEDNQLKKVCREKY